MLDKFFRCTAANDILFQENILRLRRSWEDRESEAEEATEVSAKLFAVLATAVVLIVAVLIYFGYATGVADTFRCPEDQPKCGVPHR